MCSRSSITPVPINIVLRRSRWLQVYMLAVLLLASLALLRLPTALGGFMLVTCALAYVCSRYRPVSPASRLCYRDGQWLLQIDGELQAVELTHATVWQWLVALDFRYPGCSKKQPLLLLADTCEPGEFRRLKVLLRHFPVISG